MVGNVTRDRLQCLAISLIISVYLKKLSAALIIYFIDVGGWSRSVNVKEVTVSTFRLEVLGKTTKTHEESKSGWLEVPCEISQTQAECIPHGPIWLVTY
jgi:hypothetical protein